MKLVQRTGWAVRTGRSLLPGAKVLPLILGSTCCIGLKISTDTFGNLYYAHNKFNCVCIITEVRVMFRFYFSLSDEIANSAGFKQVRLLIL